MSAGQRISESPAKQEIGTERLEGWERRLALRHTPYVTCADVLQGFAAELGVQTRFEANLIPFEPSANGPRLAPILTYRGRLKKIFAGLQNPQTPKVGDFIDDERQYPPPSADSTLLQKLFHGLARRCKSDLEAADLAVDPVPAFEAFFQLLFLNRTLGTFGVPNRLWELREPGDLSCTPYIVRLQAQLNSNPLPCFRWKLWNGESRVKSGDWSEPIRQENRTTAELLGTPIYKWYELTYKPEGTEENQARKEDLINLYIPLPRFGRFRGFLLLRIGDEGDSLGDRLESASEILSALYEKPRVPSIDLRRYMDRLHTSWSEGVRTLALDGLRHVGALPTFDDGLRLWREILGNELGWIDEGGEQPENESVFLFPREILDALGLQGKAIGIEANLGPLKLQRELADYERPEEWESFTRSQVAFAAGLLRDIVRSQRMLAAEHRARQQARRSGVVTIMARNMSHNIGSHVLAQISRPDDLEDGPTLRDQVAWLNGYLRTRMDFIADVATATPAMRLTMSLFRDVLDEHLGYGRDRDRRKLVLDFITGIQSLRAGHICLHRTDGQDDQPVAIANGVLGTHALYVIIENMIRNCAKHAYDPVDHDRLTFKVSTRPSEQFLEVTIADSLRRDGIRPLIERMNALIERPILTDAEKLDDEAWGMKEMRTCAAYLRSVPLEDIDLPQYKLGVAEKPEQPPLLEALESERRLAYRFYLPLPQDVLILNAESSVKKELRPQGLRILSESEIEPGEPAFHDFVADCNSGARRSRLIKGETNANLPLRGLSLTQELQSQLFGLTGNSAHTQSLVTELWSRWTAELRESKKLLLRLNDSAAADMWNELSGPESSWIEATTDWEMVTGDFARVVFDRHGKLLLNGAIRLASQGADDGSLRQIEGAYFYDPFPESARVRPLLAHPPEDVDLRRRFALEVLEAACCGIIILDERIQRLIQEDSHALYLARDNRIPVKEVLRYNRIFVPSRSSDPLQDFQVDLDSPQHFGENLQRWLFQFGVSEGKEAAQFLVVHLGVVEKLVENQNQRALEEQPAQLTDDEMQRARELIAGWEEATGSLVILTSGRGSPPTVKKLGCRFVHYSNIARYTLEAPSKFHLCKVLSGARRLRDD